ncbi:MAG: UDP-N-acetylmuramate dehydrogenase [Clostridiales bacterium]|nr:UDP-N-acetylmuramate dehydrogenase [Clostridiales bacterium]
MDLALKLAEQGFDGLVKDNVSMKKYCTFKAGGAARYFAEPSTEEELKNLLSAARELEIKTIIIGNGSNILFSDNGFNGLVVKIGKGFSKLDIISENDDELVIEAGAGALLSAFGNTIANEGYEGAEFCCGIPGSVGGAVFMNAGAYGREMKDIVTEVTYIDPVSLTIGKMAGSDCEFGYRTSFFEKSGMIIIKAKASLKKGDPKAIMDYVNELKNKRTSSQPLEMPSAGSTFKRPTGYFAGALIEQAGLKGFALDESGAMVSAKHAGFVVNVGGTASATDIYRLISYVIDKVEETSGVRLEPEVRLIGF